jgi:hypothetical protein
MRTKIVDQAERSSVSATGLKRLAVLLLVAVGAAGCGGPYYGPGYAGPGPYYGPGYGSSASVVVAVQDRPYYTHGPGYYVGRSYYAWRPGHWSRRGVWVPGHYVLVTR